MSRRTTEALAAAAVILCLAAPATARAADLEWVAPSGCSSRESVLDAVTRALGSSSTADVGAIRARAVVESSGRGWRVQLSTANGERTLAADTCEQLAEAVALILALAVEPARATAQPEERAAPPEPEKEAALPASTAAKASLLAIGAGQVADFGTMPSAAAGAEIFAAIRVPPLRIEVAGALWAPQRQSVVGTSAGGELMLISGVAHGCFLPVLDRFELGGCVGAGVDSMNANAFGPIVVSRGSGAWIVLAGEARVGLSLLPWLAIHAGFGLQVPVTRPSFVIEGVGQVHRPAPLSGRQALTLEARFL
ncbi:MAG: putative secreted protein [Myxococcaceae bacterium]|nr:putative secreted protein [Myxococcaceae bacterium]